MTHLPDSDLRELEGRLETTAAAILAGGSIKFYAKPGLATDIRALIADLRETREALALALDQMEWANPFLPPGAKLTPAIERLKAKARIKELEGKT